jgi:hypothetical protein
METACDLYGDSLRLIWRQPATYYGDSPRLIGYSLRPIPEK